MYILQAPLKEKIKIYLIILKIIKNEAIKKPAGLKDCRGTEVFEFLHFISSLSNLKA